MSLSDSFISKNYENVRTWISFGTSPTLIYKSGQKVGNIHNQSGTTLSEAQTSDWLRAVSWYHLRSPRVRVKTLGYSVSHCLVNTSNTRITVVPRAFGCQPPPKEEESLSTTLRNLCNPRDSIYQLWPGFSGSPRCPEWSEYSVLQTIEQSRWSVISVNKF